MADIYISKKDEKGTINISEEVVSNIVRKAIIDVEGVSGLSNTAGAEIAEFIGIKSIPKGVRIQKEDSNVVVDAVITVKYGNNIVEIAKTVQDKVKTAIESNLGFDDSVVNIHVVGISF